MEIAAILLAAMRTKSKTAATLSEIGERVRELRADAGLSQAGLAEKAAVHANVIGRLERGSYNPLCPGACCDCGGAEGFTIQAGKGSPIRS